MTTANTNIVKEQTARAAVVFAFEQTRQQLDGAEEFGVVQYLFQPNSGRNSRSSIWDTESVAQEICEALTKYNYDPAIDFICVSGSCIPLAIYIATVTAEYGRFKALLFDAKERNYVCRELGAPLDD